MLVRALAKTYSGGMRRRLDLAASLVLLPPVLFLDEPTTGLHFDDIAKLVKFTIGGTVVAPPLAGALFGLCCLVRPTLQLLLPLSLLVIALVRRWRNMVRPVALATACWAVLLAPWFVYQQSIPASPGNPNLLRMTLYHGSFPDFMYEGQQKNEQTASDACNSATVVQDSDTTAAGSCANNYSETVTWHAVDACGNTSAILLSAPIASR